MAKVLAFACVLAIGAAAIDASLAAPPRQPGAFAAEDAYAALRPRGKRELAQADCMRRADSMNFGRRFIQRRNYLRNCMMQQGFRQP